MQTQPIITQYRDFRSLYECKLAKIESEIRFMRFSRGEFESLPFLINALLDFGIYRFLGNMNYVERLVIWLIYRKTLVLGRINGTNSIIQIQASSPDLERRIRRL